MWNCTSCKWTGPLEECSHVMYRGVDWEQCPDCKAIAIPAKGSHSAVAADRLNELAHDLIDGFVDTIEERKKKTIRDEDGRIAMPIPESDRDHVMFTTGQMAMALFLKGATS